MKRTIIILILACLSIVGHTQSLLGPTSVNVGGTYRYEFTGSPISNPYWMCGGGTVVYGCSTYANVQFTSGGDCYVYLANIDTEDEYTIYVTATLAAPTVYVGAATNVTSSGFTANWNSVTGATSYRLDVSTSSSFMSFVSGYNNLTVSGTSQAVTGLSSGTTYYYRVRAAAGGSVSSNSSTVSVLTVPGAPTSLSASSVSTTSFAAYWGSSTSASGYKLDVSTSSSFSSFVSGYNNLTVIGTSEPVTGLSPGTTYYFRVRAVNTSGTSANSSTCTVITLPSAPGGLGSSSVTASSFTASWGSVTGASSYRLDVSTSSSFASYVSGYNNLTVGSTSQSVTGLSAGTTHYFRVRAVNSTGASANSTNESALTLPSAPTGLGSSSVTTTSFTASWGSVTGAASYRLDVSTSSTFASYVGVYNNLTVGGTSQSVTGLSSGTTYYFRVRAVNASGTSASSSNGSALTLPAAPTGLGSSSVTASSFTASWGSVTGATSYRLDVSTSSSFASYVSGYNNLTVGSTSQSVTGLSAGTTYYYRTRAVNATGASTSSAASSVPTVPGTPGSLSATSVATTSFTANWGAVTGAASYRLDVSTSSSFTTYITGYNNLTVGGTSQSVTGLSPVTTYYFRARAVNASGASASSSNGSAHTTIAAPTASGATNVASSSFTANWGSVVESASYRLDVSTSGSFSSFVTGYNNLTVNGTSQAVTGLSQNTQYYYRVRAVNGSDVSANSGTISPKTLKAGPTGIWLSDQTDATVDINWFGDLSATGYVLDVSTSSTFQSYLPNYHDRQIDTGYVTTHTITGLSANSTYYARARGVYYPAIYSDYSSTVTIYTAPPAPVANAPAGITATSFTASWNNVTGVTGYYLDVLNSSGNIVSGYNNVSVANNSYEVTGLSPTTVYGYRVRSYNANAVSEDSNEEYTRTKMTPPVASAATSVAAASFTANWNAVTGATGYRLYVSTNSQNYGIQHDTIDFYGSTQATNMAVTGRSANTEYYYWVRAYNAQDSSLHSDMRTVLTLPSAPTGLGSSNVTAASFTASWGSVSGISSYRLDVSAANDFSSFVGTYNDYTVNNAASQSVTGLSSGTTYYFRVRAANASGVSTSSAVDSVLTVPGTPTSLSATGAAPTSFMANWGSVTGAGSYRLDVSTSSGFASYVGAYENYTVNGGTSQQVTGLSPLTTYYFRVRAVNSSGTSASSSNGSARTTITAPTASAATNLSSSSFTANWGSVAEAEDYRLDVSTSNIFASYVSGYNNLTVAGTSQAVTGLTQNTQYYYRVRAVNGSDTSANSATVSPETMIAGPTNVWLSDWTSDSVDINWYGGEGVVRYLLDVSVSSTFQSYLVNYHDRLVDTGYVTTHNITGLEANSTYYARVRSEYPSSTYSDYSDTVAIYTPPEAPVANAPTGITATSFTASWNNVTGVTGYYLDVLDDNENIVSGYNNVPVAANMYEVTGLSPTTVYGYRVRSRNGDATSEDSNEEYTRTKMTPPLATAISNIAASSFVANWESVYGATGYKVFISTNPQNYGIQHDTIDLYNGNAEGNSLFIQGLSPNTTYYCWVRAYNSQDSSLHSNMVSATTLLQPPAVWNATEVTSFSYTANWSADTGAINYILDLGPGGQIYGITENSYNVTDLTPNTEYPYRVSAVNVTGPSAYSSYFDALTAPDKPTLRDASNVEDSYFTANWYSEPGAEYYLVFYSLSDTFGEFDTLSTSETYAAISGLYDDTAYYYRVKAANRNDDMSGYSETMFVKTLPSELVGYNYVKTETVFEDGILNAQNFESLESGDNSVTYEFYDGLGRLSQIVDIKASPSMKDIVRPIAYDTISGREILKYLPYTVSSSDYFRTDAIAEQSYFYANQQGIAHDGYPFSETVFENSPLGRTIEQGAPGADWQVEKTNGATDSTGNTIRYQFGSNSDSSVLRWVCDESNNVPVAIDTNMYYAENSLYRTRIYDENATDIDTSTVWTEEYKDSDGNIVLKRSSDGTDIMDTYYVYNRLRLLAYVLPPLTTFTLDGNDNTVVAAGGIDSLCYTYKYDGRNRMVSKKLPGADEILIVYDNYDRPVLTQDGELRNVDGWFFTKYDALNRPVLTGRIILDSLDYGDLTELFGNYDSVMYESIDLNSTNGYSLNNSFPSLIPDVEETDLLTATFYDGYSFLSLTGFSGLGFDTLQKIDAFVGDSTGYFETVKGLVTGTMAKVLDGNEFTANAKWLREADYFDDRYRNIQSRTQLFDNTANPGTGTISSRYHFGGQIERLRESQTFSGDTLTVDKYFGYDHQWRLTGIEQEITGDSGNGRTVLEVLAYNELGQLAEKDMGNGIQSVDYNYNIRGWLERINDPDNLANDGTGDTNADLFAMELLYQNEEPGLSGDVQYNGNISGVVWRTEGKSEQGYAYDYDGLNRLLGSDHKTNNGSAWAEDAVYEEKDISYDKNGNITALLRTDNAGATKDDFVYDYSGGNQLTSINSGTAYAYDGNGNMVFDGLRGFDVNYNILNLPSKIKQSSDSISYIYTATGEKVAKRMKDNGYIYYAGDMVYNDDKSLNYIITEDGVVRKTGSDYVYEYNLSDHLGNTRVVFKDDEGDADILQLADYYPFGSVHAPLNPTNGNKYLYNNKEKQDDVLGTTALDWYDYGARFYDPTIGRFTTIDPLAEKYHSISTFAYCFNNPIRFIDPDGRSATNYEDEEGKRLLTTNDGNNSTITVKKDQMGKFINGVHEMALNRTLDDKQSNVNLIDAVTPATDGVFFTDKQMAWMYMNNNNIENVAWTTQGGVVVEPTEGKSIVSGQYEKNTASSSDVYLGQKANGSSLSITLNGKDYPVNSFVHDHPFIPGGMNDNVNVFSGTAWKYPNGNKYYSGDIGFYQGYKDRGVNFNMYLIGPRDVVQYTNQKVNNVVGRTSDLLKGQNLIR